MEDLVTGEQVSQIYNLHQGRAEAEELLSKLGVSATPASQAATPLRYFRADVDKALAEHDSYAIAEAVTALDAVGNIGLAEQVIEGAVEAMRERTMRDLSPETQAAIAQATRLVTRGLRELHNLASARYAVEHAKPEERSTREFALLGQIDRIEGDLLAALAERRAAKPTNSPTRSRGRRRVGQRHDEGAGA